MTSHEAATTPDYGRRRRACAAAAAVLVLVGTGSFVAWSSQPDEAPESTPGQSAAPATAGGPVREAPASKAPASEAGAPAPVALRIPSIDVDRPLIQLGLREDNTVEVPEDGDDAGWFDLGTRPGDVGSAVILGHVDSLEGPAVFARLQELTPGQRVEVDGADGRVSTFEVTSVEIVPNEDFPAQKVYASSRGRTLNLVTCGGTYDKANGGYQSNVIVYTRLVGSTEPRSS